MTLLTDAMGCSLTKFVLIVGRDAVAWIIHSVDTGPPGQSKAVSHAEPRQRKRVAKSRLERATERSILAGCPRLSHRMEYIRIRGARTHNLKNINLDLPRHRLIVITGLSGSGKSSLAFDTLYAEGQRRYVESLSAYARQFLQLMEKPDVDLIEGLSPA